MSVHATIVWFRKDLRTVDHPALVAAARRGAVVPVFIWSPDEWGEWSPGGALQVYIHLALDALAKKLDWLGLKLICRRADRAGDALDELVNQTGADAVYWNRGYEPAAIELDKKIKAALRERGIAVESFNGALLYEPHEVATQAGEPYKVFSPFWRACQKLVAPAKPMREPRDVAAPARWPESESIDDLGLMPDHPWGEKIARHWQVGQDAALKQLRAFCKGAINSYKDDRNRPDLGGTSVLSPALAIGTLSPRQAYHEASARRPDAPDMTARQGIEHYVSELGWREFSYHLIYHFPHTTDQNLRRNFDAFPWIDMRQGRHWLEDWQRGRTGYPIVDAGMRQLWATGWMHNRVRMIVASFLTKHLRIDWREGAQWFWDCLVDADLASNTQGWQWSAGCGADAQPYFRIFNPILQGEKFDPDGEYVKKWVPELADVPTKWIHEPWQAPPAALTEAGVTLGEEYPQPMVDHGEARVAALAAFEKIKG